MIRHSYYNFFNLLKLNLLNKKIFFISKITNKIVILVKILHGLGIIRNFYFYKTKNDKKFIKVFLFYFKKTPLFNYFRLISTPSHFCYISLKALRLLNKHTGNAIFLLDTNKGLMTHREALIKNLGGRVLLNINF